MSLQTWQETLITQQGDSTAITSGGPTSLLLPAAKITLPNNYFQIGKMLRISARGKMNTVATAGTAQFDVRLGGSGTVFSSTNGAGGLIKMNVATINDMGWYLEIILTCRVIGTAANLMGHGKFVSQAVIGSPVPTTGGSGSVMLPYNAPPLVGGNFDSTLPLALDLLFTWGATNPGSITLQQYMVESLN